MPPTTDPPCPTCTAHSLLVDNVTALRETFDRFVAHAAEEHTRIREEQARQAEEFRKELLEVVRSIGESRARHQAGEPAAGPHPMTRAEDYEQRVVLQLSRKDLWKVLGFVALLLALTLGLALVAGRDGLDIWGRTVGPAVPELVK